MKTTICSIGECMIEMTNVEKELYNYSVAGDTLNFISYLDQSIFNKFYLTAIGTSDINKGVISFLKNKNIFIKKQRFDYIYLTGITLSLLDAKNIDKFISNLSILRKKNSKIIFDFNIRIKRWSKKNLNLFLNTTLPNIDILFCSGEDLVCWKKNDHIKTFENILKKFNIFHAIFRKNEKYNYSFYKNKKYMIKNKPIKKVVDTSGAGDGYNAAYLSNFIISKNPQLALNEASKIGAKIVMQKGAIVNVK